MWYIDTIQHYLVITKRMKYCHLHAVIWMDLDNIILSELSQRKTNMISLIHGMDSKK